MSKDLTTYAVAKKGNEKELLGYADATQIAKSRGKLVLFDADKATKIEVEKKVTAATARTAVEDKKLEATKAVGGADAKAVKKGP